ncbi:MAG: hypothetical protein V4671_29270 [Armatimonadota bacterium]
MITVRQNEMFLVFDSGGPVGSQPIRSREFVLAVDESSDMNWPKTGSL